jgi:hypothetical protein
LQVDIVAQSCFCLVIDQHLANIAKKTYAFIWQCGKIAT